MKWHALRATSIGSEMSVLLGLTIGEEERTLAKGKESGRQIIASYAHDVCMVAQGPVVEL
jgi:hypothetical protein